MVVESLQAQAVPRFRSGVLVNFPVEHPRGALLSVRLENGDPLPTGVLVTFETREGEFPSGTNGEVYVTGLAAHNDLRADWRGKSCRFSVDYKPTPDPLPRLGPYTCKSVAP
jgi:outer membrane usher protein